MNLYKFECSYVSDSLAIDEFESTVPQLERLYQGKIRIVEIKHPIFGIYPVIIYTVEKQRNQK